MRMGRAATILLREIAKQSAALGCTVSVDERLLDRSDAFALARPGLWSANRSCRLVRGGDGWMAVNFARETDRELLPAWTETESRGDVWNALVRWARQKPVRQMVERAVLLGLPVAQVAEVGGKRLAAPLRRMGEAGTVGRKVIDLSSLWAGPLCGALFAEAGFAVTKVDSRQRPDPTQITMPEFDERLNGAKCRMVCDFGNRRELDELRARILDGGIVITSARRRAFDQLGIDAKKMFAERPGLVWVAISGYGWMGDGANRVAFGDDAAAAGGLVRMTASGAPRFVGDALADPLTGMAAAAAAFKAIARGGGVLVDAALSAIAAGAARV